MTNELATKPTLDLAPLGEEAAGFGEILALFNEEMDGLGAIPIPRISTPAGGSIAFTIGEGDEAEITKELRGVIVYHHANNAYYSKSIEESDGEMVPDCSSYDGKVGLVHATGELRNCAECPFNQFGDDGRKPCSNRYSVYLLREEDMLPTLISLPATSRANFKKFIANNVVLKRRRSTDVVVKITLEKAESKGGQPFSRYKFALDTVLQQHEKEVMRNYGDDFKQYITERNAEYMRRDAPVAPVETVTVTARDEVIDVNYQDLGIKMPF